MKRTKRFFRPQVRHTITHTHTPHTVCDFDGERERDTRDQHNTHEQEDDDDDDDVFSFVVFFFVFFFVVFFFPTQGKKRL